MSHAEAAALMSAAIGRLLLIASRPEQPGDVATFFDCRSAVMSAAEVLGIGSQPVATNHRPGWNFGNAVLD